MENPTRKPTYSQAWHEYNLSQTREKAYFQELLYQLCQGLDQPVRQGRGRPSMPISDLIFAACTKVYEGMSGRRTQTDMREARARGYLSREVHYNTIFKYLEMESLTPYIRELITESSLPLKTVEVDFAIDSSGLSTSQHGRWLDAKYKGADRNEWLKVHVMTGVKTNIITSVEISRRYSGDSLYFKPLLDDTARNFTLREVSADKAYDSFNNRRLVLLKGGEPYIPFRSNATPSGRPKGEVWRRMFHYYNFHQEEFNTHYHKRSNVETTFSMIKRKFGERLMSKTERAQINESLSKVLCHNLCVVIQSIHELGLEVEFMGKITPCP